MGNADKTPIKFWRTHLAQNHRQQMEVSNEIFDNEFGVTFVSYENGKPTDSANVGFRPGVKFVRVDLELDPGTAEQNLETLKIQEHQLARVQRLLESVLTLTQEASNRVIALRLSWKRENERLTKHLDRATALRQMAEKRSFITDLQALIHLTTSRTFSDTDPPQRSRRASFSRLCCCA
jgi:hypothetical protein